jgi:YidC/Oxa1 family membrane protein insertase
VVAAIMVVLMGATTFWTQRQMIARSGTTDPQQIMVQKLLLYVLPLSFAVSGVFFPIGVLLYWLTTNVWSMGQQAWVIKRMPPPNLGTADAGPKGVSLSKEPPGGKGPKGKSPQGKGPQAGKPKPESPTGGSPKGGSPKGGSPTGGSPKGGSPNGGSPNGGSPNGGDPDPAARSVPAGVGGRAAAGPAKAPAPRQGKRASAGSRKNKNRRGGRR